MSETPAIFLPGILMPPEPRYAPLLAALGPGRPLVTKPLEVYAGGTPPDPYSIQTEVDGLDRFADEHGFERFHLYGHSAGGAVSLAYIAQHPEKVVTLAVDEPASDYSDDDRAVLEEGLPASIEELPVPERMAAFARTLVRPGVELDPPPPSDDPEMAKRPAGLVAFRDALVGHRVDQSDLAAFDRPVLYTYGSLSNPRWEAMAQRLASVFPSLVVERFEGIHHLRTSHQAEPERVAALLTRHWANVGSSGAAT